MPKFIVKRAWYGVEKGEVVEMAKVHPSLRPNLEQMPEEAKLTPSIPSDKKDDSKKTEAKKTVGDK